jgi:DnaJ-class molecular chaperone
VKSDQMASMSLYDRLDVDKNASTQQIRNAYRRESRKHHPDANKLDDDAEARFKLIREAHDILVDDERRARYDITGRMNVTQVTPQAIERFLVGLIRQVASAEKDDPKQVDVRWKIVKGVMGVRQGAESQFSQAEQLVKRITVLLDRFNQKNKDGKDIVRITLLDELKSARQSQDTAEDAVELADKTIEFLNNYEYKVGPDSEGPRGSGPTLHIGHSRREEKLKERLTASQ